MKGLDALDFVIHRRNVNGAPIPAADVRSGSKPRERYQDTVWDRVSRTE